ncbi:MAG: 4Fe-4S dicluster domain-containing protein, partial [Cyanobacteria bacterium P01_H01_bin.130]
MTTTNAVPDSSDAPTDPTTPRVPARESQFLSQNPHLLDPALDQSSETAETAETAPAAPPMAGMKSGFDGQHPPEKGVIDTCVHCGFCLATCPSYRVLGTEMDSPRGRIYLMDAIAQGEAQLDETAASHFDSCLGCLACTSTCPSGVRYDRLLADMRPQLERNVPRGWGDRLIRGLIFNLFPYPKRLQALLPGLWLYQKSGAQTLVRKTGWLGKLSPQLAAMESVLPAVSV